MKKLLSVFLVATLLVSVIGLSYAEEGAYTMPVRLLSPEKTTITYMTPMHALQTNLDDYQYIADLEAATNVHLDATWVAAGQWSEKKNLTLAGGVSELPDILNGVSGTDIATYGPQGYFVPIDEYLSEDLTPNLLALFEKYPDYKAAITSSDGHIYQLPTINMLPFRQSPFNMFINTEWLNKLNLSMPTNYQELYDVLVAFRDNDCNGNGDAGDEIPLAGNWLGGTDYFRWVFLFAMFGFPVESDMLYVNDDYKVCLAPLEPGYDTALAYFKKLYAEGLLDPETFTQDNAAYTAKGQQDPARYGIYFDWFGTVVAGEANFAQYDVLAPMAGPDGKTVWTNRGTRGFYGGGGVAVSAGASDIKTCIGWLDYLYNPEISMQTTRGNIGTVLYFDETDGKYHSYDAPEGYTADSFRVLNVPAEALPFAFMADQVAQVVLPANMQRKIDVFYPVNAQYMSKNYLPALNLTLEESSDLAIYQADIGSYLQKMIPSFITGQADIETGFADFQKQLEAMGAAEYLNIYQTGYDRFLAAAN